MPTARKAMSLTTASAAIASIRPSWCSVASMWRVPNSQAKIAIPMAMISVMSLKKDSGPTPPDRSIWSTIVVTESDTAFSCSAI
jgi:hypothetical protein